MKRPIGNTADLNAPHTLRHAASANYPFNTKNIDGVGQRIVVDGVGKEVRRIKSDLATVQGRRLNSARETSEGKLTISTNESFLTTLLDDKCHKRSPSYNSMYLGHNRMTSVPVIPEVRVEDTEESSLKREDGPAANNDEI